MNHYAVTVALFIGKNDSSWHGGHIDNIGMSVAILNWKAFELRSGLRISEFFGSRARTLAAVRIALTCGFNSHT
jgi:hypothetical protein